MRWRMYKAPEFMKLMMSDYVMDNGDGKGSPYSKFEYSMYIFEEWAGRKLDEIYRKDKEFIPGKKYDLYMTEKDDVETIREFAKFYIRSRRDPLSGRCAYKEKIEEANQHTIEIDNKLDMEYFTFINKPPTFENVNLMAFIITAVNVKPLSSNEKVDARITIECIAYK